MSTVPMSPIAAIPSDQLGVQAHCLRHAMAADFTATLKQVAALGLHKIELCSFPGCVGNPWGDFGALAGWAPQAIQEELQKAGLRCVSTHFMAWELGEEHIENSISWALGVGSPIVVLAGIPFAAEPSLADWQVEFENLNHIGSRLAGAGLTFAYHTQNNAWSSIDGRLIFDEMMHIVDPGLCAVELDLSGALVYGADWANSVQRHPGRFMALHLRDGRRPPRTVPYLPALPLGEGEMDWRHAVALARRAGVPCYFLEMEIEHAPDVFAALETSLAFLLSHQLLER